jgi:hypothetical protein
MSISAKEKKGNPRRRKERKKERKKNENLKI